MRCRYIFLLLATTALVSACDGAGSDTMGPTLSMRVVGGDGIADTILAKPAQALTVELLDNGRPRAGVVVWFTTLPPLDTTRPGEPVVTVSRVERD